MKLLLSLFLLSGFGIVATAQPITGVWRGKITSGKGMFASTCRVELKLIKEGDSLVGTAYYFSGSNNYIRYSVKGYFNKADNSVHWQDAKLIGMKPVGTAQVGIYSAAMVSNADFNCPGKNVMMLDGRSQIGSDGPEFVLHYDKIDKPLFPDEWDNVIDGYFEGMNDPGIIDSVFAIAKEFVPEVSKDAIARADRRNKKNRPTEPVIAGPVETPLPPPVVAVAVVAEAKPVVPPPEVKQTVVAVPEPVKPELAKIDPPKEEKPVVVKPVEPPPVIAKAVVPPPPPKPAPVPEKKEVKAVVPEIKKPVTPPPVVKTVAVVKPAPPPPVVKASPPVVKAAPVPEKKPDAPIVIKQTVAPERIDPVAVEKFVTRRKIEQAEIPLVGDTMELNFYDNAEVDGDSISVFLNGKLLFNHVLLTAQAYTFKLDIKDLPTGSELTMVAENMGTIPPNTAYMMAIVDGQRYSARLESTEQSSGVIKLVRR